MVFLFYICTIIKQLSSMGSKEQRENNSKLVIDKLKSLNKEINGTNYNEARYWINKLPQYVPTWFEYLKNKSV